MTASLTNVQVDEISILSTDMRPAVKAARIAITKMEVSTDTFMRHVEAVQKLAGCSRGAAMRKAVSEYPEAFAAFQEEGRRDGEAFTKLAHASGSAKAEFQLKVDGLMARSPGMKRTAAMRQIARENPHLLAG